MLIVIKNCKFSMKYIEIQLKYSNSRSCTLVNKEKDQKKVKSHPKHTNDD